MDDCIFCKIVNGDVPCRKVFENERVLAFLSIEPVVVGHLLVIPKEHYENIFDVPEDVLCEVNGVCKRMALLVREKLGASGVNVLNASGGDAQQTVFHLHYHIIPRNAGDGLDLRFHGRREVDEDLDEVYGKLVGN
jgi:histidine triad (HIT) family protein